MEKVLKFFDKLEDHIRGRLSPHPILYGLVAGISLILFWRGIWESATLYGMHPITSIIVGLIGLLLTGVFVSAFIGSRLIISGIKGEKKIEEKTLEEIADEESSINKVLLKLDKIENEIEEIRGRNQK
jgi:hypothetical protein